MAVLVSVVLLVKEDIAVALSGGRRWKAALYTRIPFLYKHSLMAVT